MATFNHDIYYNANGGHGAPSTQTVESSSYFSFVTRLSWQQPFRNGYTFIGWSLSSTSETAEYQPNGYYAFNSHNVTLYAIWKAPITITIEKQGDGTVRVNNSTSTTISVKYGGNVSIQAIATNNYYLHKVLKDTSVISDKDLLTAFNYNFIAYANTTLSFEFLERLQHTLSVISEFEVKGQGTYYYLDRPTLLANLSSAINFDGWYSNGEKLSSENPYTFSMPDSDLELTLEVGGSIFYNADRRQFALQNGDGEVYRLTDKNSKIFLDSPTNLGMKKTIKTLRIGNAETVSSETYNMPQPGGKLIFYKDGNSGKYEDYYKFVRFINRKPITLWYRTPALDVNNEFHIPVEVLSLGKEEIKEDRVMTVPIQFYCTKFWQITDTEISSNQNSIEVYNDSDFDVGIHLTLKKFDETNFTNPKIRFLQNDVEYGAIAISYSNLSKIEFDSRDKNQLITLYNGNNIIANPFAYIDFSYADGVKDFPFPKLRQGYSEVVFTFNGDTSTNKSYLVEFDKEFLSV